MSAAAAFAAAAVVHPQQNARCGSTHQPQNQQQQQQQQRRQPALGHELCAGGFEVAHGQVHPWHLPAVPSREALREAPTYPVVVTANPVVHTQVLDGSHDPQHHLPINQARPMAVASDIFDGVMAIHLRGLPNTQPGLFEGKKRFFHIMCQGRFKRPVAASALCMGQEFVKPGNAPPWVGELVFTAAAKVFSSSTQVDAYAEMPFFMNPLLAACQLVNVSRPGSEPPLAQAAEDMRLFAPELADKQGAPLSPDKRRKWCDVPKHLDGLVLDTANVWTFHIYQHLIDFSTYKLSVGSFVNIDLAPALNGQPLQLTVCDTQNKQYLFSALVWHEHLLHGSSSSSTGAEGHTAMQQLSERLSRLGTNMRSLLGRKA